MITIFLTELSAPSVYALTSGPTQPEVQSFQPISANDMVNLFTGDFSYNIPLLELPGPNGGYGFNLAYDAGVTMEQEASWVGLGWNLNPGAIVRNKRGLPDEFDGVNDKLKVKKYMKPNVTKTYEGALDLKFFSLFVKKDKPLPDNTWNLNLGLKFQLSHNNYYGPSLSFSPSLTTSRMRNTRGNNPETKWSLGGNMSLDTKEGYSLGLMGSAGLIKGRDDGFNLNMTFNGRDGLSTIGLDYNFGRKITNKDHNKTIYMGSTLSFANAAKTPSITDEFNTFSESSKYSFGVSNTGGYLGLGYREFITHQKMRHNGEERDVAAVGYFYSENANNDCVLDINREKDGVYEPNVPFLPIPQFTYDIFSVSGHGIGGSFRAVRGDIGVSYDKATKSEDVLDGFGFQAEYGVGVGETHWKAGLNGEFLREWSNKWGLAGPLGFKQAGSATDWQPAFFKMVGENAMLTTSFFNSIGGNAPLRVNLISHSLNAPTLLKENGSSYAMSNSTHLPRVSRNTVIQQISNKQLKNNVGELGEFNVKYFNSGGSLTDYSRTSLKDNHFAGFIATTPAGMRYCYTLPVYNKTETEANFATSPHASALEPSVTLSRLSDGSIRNDVSGSVDNYLSRTVTPEYAHSFLLTSILGNDYVDADNIKGPSKGDLGYWVKFTYQKVSDNYKWRSPFYGGRGTRGFYSKTDDDKASYMYGEKEIWYLKTAETKSHIVEFILSNREDGRGAKQEVQNITDGLPTDTGSFLKKVDEIKLYTRAAHESGGSPIQKVKFLYDYSLCTGLPNSTANGGKLTLKKLWFEYESSKRGELTPYKFEYSAFNPPYDMGKLNRWGEFEEYGFGITNYEQRSKYPYVPQFSNPNRDLHASAWRLSKVSLPTGGIISVDYESDDYAYVQNKQAMQMFPIASVGTEPVAGELSQYHLWKGNGALNDDSTRIYFPLKEPLLMTSVTNPQDEAKKYIDTETKQLYFKIDIAMHEGNKNIEELVGYADIDMRPESMGLWGPGGHYTHGYISVRKVKSKNKEYHPVSLFAWQYCQLVQRALMLPDAYTGQIEMSRLRHAFVQIFFSFFSYAKSRNWGRNIQLNNAYIRLNIPDFNKFGGGYRVKKIVLSTDWNSETVIGQTYEYTTINEEGVKISSGVASYEPMLGGDEIALRNARKYNKSFQFKASQHLYADLPVNEQYYPAPVVGYSKVVVKSIASRKKENPTLISEIPDGFLGITTGAAVNEFYTAKDFPVISEATSLKEKTSSSFFDKLFFIGAYFDDHVMATSQGFVVALNDMHGKPKFTGNYPQDESGRVMYEAPTSWTMYHYKKTEQLINNKKAQVLNNSCLVLVSDEGGIEVSKETKVMGVEVEFFADARQTFDQAISVGATIDGDVITKPIPLPVILSIPNISISRNSYKTVSVNKVIHRTGILESVEAFNGQVTVKTKNLLWDGLTGNVVLTSVTNEFDKPIYAYSLPAYMVYEGMGPAYKNTGLNFKKTVNQTSGQRYTCSTTASDAWADFLFKGDEFIVNNGLGRAVFAGRTGSTLLFDIKGITGTTITDADFFLFRSGRRNHLDAQAASLSALKDPTAGRTSFNANSFFQIPNN